MNMKKYFLLVMFFCLNVFWSQNIFCCLCFANSFFEKIVNIIFCRNVVCDAKDFCETPGKCDDGSFVVKKITDLVEPNDSIAEKTIVREEIADFANRLNEYLCVDNEGNLPDLDLRLCAFKESLYNLDCCYYKDFLTEKVEYYDWLLKHYKASHFVVNRICCAKKVISEKLEK